MKFTSSIYRRLNSRLTKSYNKKLRSILNSFNKSSWPYQHRDVLSNYDPVNWYYLKQLESFLFFHEHQGELSTDDSFSQIDDAVFEAWNKSEFAQVFLKALNKGQSISEASATALVEFERHLIDLGNRHILKQDQVSKSYVPQTSLGDLPKGKVLRKLLETTLHLDGLDLKLLTHSFREMEEFSQRIEKALKLIQRFSPDSWERFKSFTTAIVPIKNKEFVSYSHQELPGYSMINLYDRDSIDLLDDLLHENGHHHLNVYLNLSGLIREPSEAIYYSPWRTTLRPLRGIYHAYFTFFWAFKLFCDLQEREAELPFSPLERQKILWRAIEEFHMLNFSYKDLVWARNRGLINEQGWTLIEAQQEILKKMSPKIRRWEKNLKNKKDLTRLKETLKEAAKTFKKSSR